MLKHVMRYYIEIRQAIRQHISKRRFQEEGFHTDNEIKQTAANKQIKF